MKNFYYYFKKGTPYCGTEEEVVIVSDSECEIDEEEIIQDLYDSYGYLINGWDEEVSEEEEEEQEYDFKSGCYVEFKEITKEQFEDYRDNQGLYVEEW